jgi:hypothetical protein
MKRKEKKHNFEGGKAQLCIKKAPVIKQGLFNLEIRT